MARSPRRQELSLTEDGAESELPDFTPMPRPALTTSPRPEVTPPTQACKSTPDPLSVLDEDETEKVRALAHLNLECPVCLQTCIHPVRLPCNHVFCFLCIKGVANHSKKCALCRHDIPVDYLNSPVLLDSDQLVTDSTRHHQGYQWYYEGRNGWWQYDERASRELEEKYSKGLKIFELLIAGFLYIIDFENMYQLRRNDPSRRRRIKRDLVTIEKKGVAGLKVTTPSVREGAYGAEGEKRPPAGPPPPPTSVEDGDEGDESGCNKSDDDLEARLERLDISTRSTDGAE